MVRRDRALPSRNLRIPCRPASQRRHKRRRRSSDRNAGLPHADRAKRVSHGRWRRSGGVRRESGQCNPHRIRTSVVHSEFRSGRRAASAEESFGGAIGTLLSPLLCGAGLGFWQITLALAAGFFAKEIVISSCAVIFGLCEVSPASLAAALGSIGFTTAKRRRRSSLFSFIRRACPAVRRYSPKRRRQSSRSECARSVLP